MTCPPPAFPRDRDAETTNRQRRRLLTAAATSSLPAWQWLAPSIASAQHSGFPSRPVRIVVGSPPGGPSDFLARMMADALGPQFNQSFVVENRPGASGMPAADQVAKSAADGHVLLASGPASIAVAPHLFPRITYDPIKDLAPVSLLGAGAFVLVAHPSIEVRNVAELIAAAKARPGVLAYGSGGNGSSGHLCTELFSNVTGTRMLHVPYKGDGQAIGDLLAGQVQLMFTAPNVGMPHVKSGRLRLLAVTTRDRVPSMPGVPTVHESGVTDFEYLGWIVVFAPAGTPKPVIESLAAAWQKARVMPAIRAKLDELAMAAPERLNHLAAVEAFVTAEHGRLGQVIRDAGVRAGT